MKREARLLRVSLVVDGSIGIGMREPFGHARSAPPLRGLWAIRSRCYRGNSDGTGYSFVGDHDHLSSPRACMGATVGESFLIHNHTGHLT
jgi:hypothetical protein